MHREHPADAAGGAGWREEGYRASVNKSWLLNANLSVTPLSSRDYRAPSAGVKIGGSTTAAGAWRRYNLPVELGELNPRPKIFKNWPRAITLLSVRTALSNRFENKVMAGAAESCRSPSKPTATEAPALV